MGWMRGPDRSAPKGECRITRILPRFFTPFGAQSLDTQGLARRPAPGDGGKSPAILTTEKALEKSGIRVELLRTAPPERGQKTGKNGPFPARFSGKVGGGENGIQEVSGSIPLISTKKA